MLTWNNPTQSPQEFAKTLDDNDSVKAATFQQEEGEQDHTPHYQGYVELTKRVRLSTLKNMLGSAIHFERRRGSAQQAIDYCQKDDTRIDGPWTIGEFTIATPGQRTDLDDAVDTLLTGGTHAVAHDHPKSWVRYHRGFQSLLYARISREREPPTVKLYIGSTEVGKSRAAWEYDPDLHSQPGESPWFDGYCGQSTLLLDDFAGAASKATLTHTLRLLDRYPVRLEVKGSFTWLKATTIIITTNIHPYNWYDWERRHKQYAALARRIHEVHVWDTEGNMEQLSDAERERFFRVPDGPLPGTRFGEFIC